MRSTPLARRTRAIFTLAAIGVIAVAGLLIATLGSPSAWPATSTGTPPGPPRSGTTLEDPLTANLDPDLLAALRAAMTDAAARGVHISISSGWRSPEDQERLLRQAISDYGSAEEAARWVASPTASPHVSGDAVDVGPIDAMTWLAEYGADYGLCQIYANEPWHFELRQDAEGTGCPPMYRDPTQDPRMQG